MEEQKIENKTLPLSQNKNAKFKRIFYSGTIEKVGTFLETKSGEKIYFSPDFKERQSFLQYRQNGCGFDPATYNTNYMGFSAEEATHAGCEDPQPSMYVTFTFYVETQFNLLNNSGNTAKIRLTGSSSTQYIVPISVTYVSSFFDGPNEEYNRFKVTFSTYVTPEEYCSNSQVRVNITRCLTDCEDFPIFSTATTTDSFDNAYRVSWFDANTWSYGNNKVKFFMFNGFCEPSVEQCNPGMGWSPLHEIGYRKEGSSGAWTTISITNPEAGSAILTLASGDYEFRIRGKVNTQGIWSPYYPNMYFSVP